MYSLIKVCMYILLYPWNGFLHAFQIGNHSCHLKTFHLIIDGSNNIESYTQELGNLHNLRFLEMSENHIMNLPNSIKGWSKLTDLYANDNLLSMLPDTFGELSSLTICKLSANRLGGLPDTVYGLSSMAELDLSHNHITVYIIIHLQCIIVQLACIHLVINVHAHA